MHSVKSACGSVTQQQLIALITGIQTGALRVQATLILQ